MLGAYRIRRGTRDQRLNPGRQAPLVPAHLSHGATAARPGDGFGIGATMAWRYIRKGPLTCSPPRHRGQQRL